MVGALSASYNRSKVMDFSYPFFYEYMSVLIKKPDAIVTKWRTLIDPFKWEVLILIGICLFLFYYMLIKRANKTSFMIVIRKIN